VTHSRRRAAERAAVANEEGRMELRHFPLFMPAGKFWLQVTMKLCLAAWLTFTWTSTLSLHLLLCICVWCIQIAWVEILELLHDAQLYWTDPLNLVTNRYSN
jgi:hypothetical protein